MLPRRAKRAVRARRGVHRVKEALPEGYCSCAGTECLLRRRVLLGDPFYPPWCLDAACGAQCNSIGAKPGALRGKNGYAVQRGELGGPLAMGEWMS